MRCKFCNEYDVDSYDECEPGFLCPNCHEYTIPTEENEEEVE